jgi:hypothetical protein
MFPRIRRHFTMNHIQHRESATTLSWHDRLQELEARKNVLQESQAAKAAYHSEFHALLQSLPPILDPSSAGGKHPDGVKVGDGAAAATALTAVTLTPPAIIAPPDAEQQSNVQPAKVCTVAASLALGEPVPADRHIDDEFRQS